MARTFFQSGTLSSSTATLDTNGVLAQVAFLSNADLAQTLQLAINGQTVPVGPRETVRFPATFTSASVTGTGAYRLFCSDDPTAQFEIRKDALNPSEGDVRAALAAASAAVSFNTKKLGPIADGTAATDACTKGQLDAAVDAIMIIIGGLS
jgi:hypothetical protein